MRMEKINEYFNKVSVNSENASLPPPTDIGREFVRQYYTKWSFYLDEVYQFYGNESCFIYDGQQAKGQENIQKAISDLEYENCKARIHSVTGLYGLNDSLVLQVCGELSVKNGAPRKFLQNFVLCKQMMKKYYVQTDIFQWLDKAFCDDNFLAANTKQAAFPKTESVNSNIDISNKETVAASKEKELTNLDAAQQQQQQNGQAGRVLNNMSALQQQENHQQQQQADLNMPTANNQQMLNCKEKEAEHIAAVAPQQNGHVISASDLPSFASIGQQTVASVKENANTAVKDLQQRTVPQQHQYSKQHHEQQQQLNYALKESHPKTWAKAVSNNSSTNNNNGSVQQQNFGGSVVQPEGEMDGISAKQPPLTFDDSANNTRKNNYKGYDKRTGGTGEYRSGGGHFNNGPNNYRYQNRDSGNGGNASSYFRGGSRGNRFSGSGGGHRGGYAPHHYQGDNGNGGAHGGGSMGSGARYGGPSGSGRFNNNRPGVRFQNNNFHHNRSTQPAAQD